MTRIFKTRTFNRWLRKVGLSDEALRQAVIEMSQGLVDADLGGNIIKKRVALPGRGKRAGTRTFVATSMGNRWFFLYGYEKSERTNINKGELKALQELASQYLMFEEAELNLAVASGKITEIS